MSDVTDALTVLLEEIPQAAAPDPIADDDFGTDLSCTDDLDEDFGEVSGLVCLLQSDYRRLTTPRGSLADDPDYGLDICSYLHQGLTPEKLAQIPGEVAGELLKDDRHETVTATAAMRAGKLVIEVTGETARGPFKLTLVATDAEALIEEMIVNGAAIAS